MTTPDRSPLTIRPPLDAERPLLAAHLERAWGSTTIVSRGAVHDAAALPALLAFADGELTGVATFRHAPGETELVTLDALTRGHGIGSALLGAVADAATAYGSRRLWLITSNDNLDAMRFYQRRGLRLAAVHRGAIAAARALKPSIPELGEHGIPILDELEFELPLPGSPRSSLTRFDRSSGGR